jgi:cyclopropane fatty-acyl-phospholipid synthase-like methyltransferase
MMAAATSAVAPSRIVAAVALLQVQPNDHVLEIGCGNGAAAALVCEHLTTGMLTGIDRSETQVRLARERNHACIESGKAAFHAMALEDATLDDAQFDVIFAINVNAFWLRHEQPLAAVKRLLRPSGSFHLFYEHPTAAKARDIPRVLRDNLTQAGFVIEQESFERVYGLSSRLQWRKQ